MLNGTIVFVLVNTGLVLITTKWKMSPWLVILLASINGVLTTAWDLGYFAQP